MTDFAKEFYDMIETYQSLGEVYDDELDIEILQSEIDIKLLHKKNPRLKFPPYGVPYFSPSSASSDERELYLKATGAKKDPYRLKPYQKRWTLAGSAWGGILQRELLFIEKHFERMTLDKPAFVPERTNEGFPMWEDFAKSTYTIDHNGQTIRLFGAPDGILRHQESGKAVGIEIKSKSTTYSKTSEHSMKEVEESHKLQAICYGIMYGVSDYLIVYGNFAKKSWNMSEEDYEKYKDLRVFHITITEEDKQFVLDKFARILEDVKNGTPSPFDIDKWTFNNFKEATAKSLTLEELEKAKKYVQGVLKSSLPQYRKESLFETWQEIKEWRSK